MPRQPGQTRYESFTHVCGHASMTHTFPGSMDGDEIRRRIAMEEGTLCSACAEELAELRRLYASMPIRNYAPAMRAGGAKWERHEELLRLEAAR